MRRTTYRAAILAGIALLITTGFVSRGTPQGQLGGFPDLVGGLQKIEGCLGVQTARCPDGKNVIFAWFEDKDAARRWYYSDMHVGAVETFFGEGTVSEDPMHEIPDEVGPIMAIASVTMAQDGAGANGKPFSQISIELYTPLAGGLAIGGRFAPESLVVPKRKITVDDEG